MTTSVFSAGVSLYSSRIKACK